jgi:hypothetical protein
MFHRRVVVQVLLVAATVTIVTVWAVHFISSSLHQQRVVVSSVASSSPVISAATTTPTPTTTMRLSEEVSKAKDYIAVAHIGNSIQYYNDSPRLLEHMLNTKFSTVRQNSCLRGGATLTSLYEKGNGMATKFSNNNNNDIGAPTVKDLLLSIPEPTMSVSSLSWDFVIINDHTQSPARLEKRKESMQTLLSKYIPLLLQQQSESTTTVIFLQTAAYKSPVKDSDDLGTFDECTAKIHEGYTEYAQLIRRSNNNGTLQAKVAPVGLAYQYLKHQHDNNDETIATMWSKLYAHDDLHPSPHGTWLEACVVYCTMLEEYPPDYDVSWWNTARYMQPPDEEPLPLPTNDEADLLRQVAWMVCQDDNNSSSGTGGGRRHVLRRR